MPRALPAGFTDQNSAVRNIETHATLQLTLLSDAAALLGYFFATARLAVLGVAYAPHLRKTGQLRLSLTRSVDRVEVELQNLDDVLGVDLLRARESLYGAEARLGRYRRDLDGGTESHKVFFTGVVADVGINEQVVRLSILSEAYAAVSVGASRRVARLCQWRFRDPRTCQYAGPELACNFLLDHPGGCQGRHGDPLKRAKYGGMIHIETRSAVQAQLALSQPPANQLIKVGAASFAQQPFLEIVGASVVDDPVNRVTKVTPTAAVNAKNDTVALPLQPGLIFRKGIRGIDRPNENGTELRTTSVPTGVRNLVADYDGIGTPQETFGSISAGTNLLTVGDASHWLPGNGILIIGAGPAGADLLTSVTEKNGSVLSLAASAGTTVAGAIVRHDTSEALQTMLTAKGHLYIPSGYYSYSIPLVLPNTTEGNSITIKGAGHHATTLLFTGLGSGIIAPAAGSISGLIIEDLTLATSTPGDPFAVRPLVNRGSAIELINSDLSLVVNWLRIRGVRIIGWGRYGFLTDNSQGCQIENAIFRGNAAGHIAMIAEDEVWAGSKEPNSNLIKGCQFDSTAYVPSSDRTVTDGAMAAGSDHLTSATAAFTLADEGRLVHAVGGGITGGNLFGIILQYVSATEVRLSVKNITGAPLSGRTVLIEKQQTADILLHKANRTVIESCIIQGNRSNSPENVNAIRAQNLRGLAIRTIHCENTGGSGGYDLKFINVSASHIDGYHSNAAPLSGNEGPGGNIQMVGCHSIKIEAMSAPNPTTHFDLDANCYGITVDNSELSAPENSLKSFDQSRDKIIFGDSVVYFTEEASPVAVQRGTAHQQDDWYGAQVIANPRFNDGKNGWTDARPGDWSIVDNGPGRHQRYALVDTQSLAADNIGLVASQVIPISDHVRPGPWVFGYDFYVENFGSSPNFIDPRAVQISLSAVGGLGHSFIPARSENFSNTPTGQWIRIQYSVYVNNDTGRSFTIQLFASRGPQTPKVRLANFRMHPGKHLAGSEDQPLTELRGGVFRAPIIAAPGIEARFYDDDGSHYVALKGPAGIAASQVFRLPGADGTSGQAVITDGAGNLSFGSIAAGANAALSNLASVAINTSLLPAADGAIDLGSTTKAWRDLYLQRIFAKGDISLDATGSSASSPRTIGVANINTGNAARIQFGDAFNALQNSYSGMMVLQSFHTLRIYGHTFGGENGSEAPVGFFANDTNAPHVEFVGSNGGFGVTVSDNVHVQIRGASGMPGGSGIFFRCVTSDGTNRFEVMEDGDVNIQGTQVLTARRTGWTAPSGTATRSGFATSTATATEVAEALKALIDDLLTHGIIGT